MRFIVPVTVFLLGLAGCANCHHRACDLALEESRCPEVPACQRMKVHAILVKGIDPLDVAGVESLRECLVEAGYPKIFRIENHHASYIEHEVTRIRCEQPEARFVIVGSGTGAMLARSLASSLAKAGADVDAVVEIAPIHPAILGPSHELNATVRHVVIGRVGIRAYSPGSKTEYRIVPELARLTPCTHPLVVEMVKEQLELSAQTIAEVEDAPFPSLPLLDQRAPAPGEFVVGTGGASS